MPRPKKDVEVYEENPFIVEDNIRGKKKRVTVKANRAIVDVETGEAENTAEICQIQEVDDEKFVKVFTQNLKAFFNLRPSSYKLLQVVMQELQRHPNNDRIYLNARMAREHLEAHGQRPMSSSAFHDALKEMLQKGFLAATPHSNLYFINPHLLFNGDRLRFVREYRRKRSGQQQLDIERDTQAGQTSTSQLTHAENAESQASD